MKHDSIKVKRQLWEFVLCTVNEATGTNLCDINVAYKSMEWSIVWSETYGIQECTGENQVCCYHSHFDCLQADGLKVPLPPRHQGHLPVGQLLEKLPSFRSTHSLH